MTARQIDQSPQPISFGLSFLGNRFHQMRTSPVFILILLYLVILSGCASIQSTPQKQISLQDAENIISKIKEQGDSVRSFYSIGVVSIKGWLLGSDADILVAGVRDPFTMKIEITHSWGKPILNILIMEGRLSVLSFQEKAVYMDAFTPEALSRFLSGFELDQEMIWSILSGRPPVVFHETVTLPRPDRISLSDNNGIELETIYLPLEGVIPEKVAFPAQSLDLFFSDLKEESGIQYAGEIKVSGKKIERDLALKINTISLNAPIPEQLFTLEIPSNYEIVNFYDIP
jgi:hypothetical protein